MPAPSTDPRVIAVLLLPILFACSPVAPTVVRSPGAAQARNCPAARRGVLQDVTTTPAAPYFVHHPGAPGPQVTTVLFLPGGSGSREIAQDFIWKNWLARGKRVEEVRVIIPYARDAGQPPDLWSDFGRVSRVLDEVLACYGGEAGPVHLAGTSNGGRHAFQLMLSDGARFASLLGSPGVFPKEASDGAIKRALSGKPVYAGVGSKDDEWKPGVMETHRRLLGLGLRSRYVEFPEQGHLLDEHFDPSGFFDFWLDAEIR